jgi:hypothetical protein
MPKREQQTSTRKTLDLPALESWRWEAARVIRGSVGAPKCKDYLPPLIFLKRLSDAFDDEIRGLTEELGLKVKALKLGGLSRSAPTHAS